MCSVLLVSSSFSFVSWGGRRGRRAGAPSGAITGTVRTSDGVPLPEVAVVLERPGSLRRVTTGPDGSFRAAALAAGAYTLRVDAPGLALRDGATVSVGATRRARTSCSRPRPSRTRRRDRYPRRGGAVDARRERDVSSARTSRARGGVAPAAAPGRAGRRDRPQRADGPSGLRFRPRRRVELRAGADRRRTGQRAGRRLQLRHGAPLGAGAGRGRARRGQQPLRHRRARGRRDPSRHATADPTAPLSFRAEGEGAASPGGASRARPRGARGAFDWNAGAAAPRERQRAAQQRLRADRRGAARGAQLGDRSRPRRRAGRDEHGRHARARRPSVRPDLDASFEWKTSWSPAPARAAGPRSHEVRAGYSSTDRLSLEPRTRAATSASGRAERRASDRATSRTERVPERQRPAPAGYQAEIRSGHGTSSRPAPTSSARPASSATARRPPLRRSAPT